MREETHIKALEDGILLLTFNTGERKLFDTTLLNGPAFEPLKDESVFRSAYIDCGIVVWMDGQIDCAPEYMYQHSYPYNEIIFGQAAPADTIAAIKS